MITRFDKYILFTFIPALFICGFVLIGVYLVVDLFQKFDDVLSLGDEALSMTFNYYALFLPVMLAKLFPAIVLIGAGFALIRLAKNDEIMAMQVAGLSLYRILLPLFVSTAIFSFIAMANQEMVIPSLADKLEKLRTITFDRSEIKDIFVEDQDNGLVLRVARYDIIDETMKNLFLVGMDKEEKVLFTLTAKEGKWVGEDTWYLSNVVRQNYKEGDWEPPVVVEKEIFLKTSIRPENMRQEERDPGLLSMQSLLDLSRKRPENPMYPVFFYSRTTYPFVSLVFLLLGAPFILGVEQLRKNLFLGISAILCIIGAFFIVTVFCINLGVTGHLHPVLAGWLPLLFFALVGFILFDWLGT
ncbi:MAG TPA: LptF/LptG family permease [Candidatus Hypogeohydataceae bacterium YC41]